ncbi:MAG: GlsB/YeaQ/YmgE family stress response membrane protein [Pirellulaceae bacterium]|nr:GlsB/YeaQ/YmgE family stress response membrane protein [Pirellulaceae bacterium]
MNISGLLIALLIGAAAGFLAGQIMKGRGFGILGNIVVGILGALVFGFLFGSLNLFNSAILNQIAGGTIGAVILLFVIGLIKKAT